MNKLLMTSTKIWKAEATIAWIFMFANVLLIMSHIIMRRFFDAPIYGSIELIKYISLCAASFALAQNEWIDGNITMSLIHEKLKPKTAARLKAITNTISSFVFIIVTYLLYKQVVQKYVNQDSSPDLQIPIWVPALVIAIGFTVLTISIIIKTILLWYIERSGEPPIDFRALVVPKENQAIES